ncbi:MAG: AEC family transporter [Candidatus Sumerlaeota bacterium]
MERFIQVLTISLPIFLLIGFGVLIRRKGLLNDAAHHFVSRFVYLFSLPVLIFLGVASKDFRQLLDGAVIGSTLLASMTIAVIFWVSSRRLKPRLRGPVTISSYIGNLSYIGFPLAMSAFGETGLTYAGVINAFTMPVFMVTGIMILAMGHSSGRTGGMMLQHLKKSLLNPVLIAAVGGLATSFVIHETPVAKWAMGMPVVPNIFEILLKTARMIGSMGLPLALIAVGGALRFEYLKGHIVLMSISSIGRIVITPLLTLLICNWLFPDMSQAARGTAVLLMGSPLSVGIYVVSREMDTDSEFLAGTLVLSTLGAAFSIPFWLFFLV